MKLIIGKNSKLVKSIEIDDDYKLVSHQDLESFDYSGFSQIYLFSHTTNQKEYLKMLSKIPMQKTIFISTSSVFSNLFRLQPFSYPSSKLNYENYVLKNGGKVCRLGIFNDEWVPAGLRYPKTKITEVKDFMRINSHQRITNLFRIVKKSGTYKKSILDNFEDFNSLYFLFAAIKKLLSYKLYGYNRDTLKAFNGKWLVGNGALGNMCYRDYGSRLDFVVSTKSKDTVLKDSGFKDTYIGKTKYGLGNLWHGVRIKEKDGKFYKDVPLFISRAKVKRNKIIYKEVCSIKKISGDNLEINFGYLQAFPEKVILASGPIENSRVLTTNADITWNGSDHEVYFYGQCLTSEAVKKGFLNSFGPIIWRSNVLTNKSDLLIDFRPGYKNLAKALDSGSFFTNNKKLAIIYRVLSRFDFERFNEAIFNKFGLALYTKKASIFFQRVVKDCITIEIKSNKIFNKSRKRLSNDQLGDHMGLLDDFNSIEIMKHHKSIDSQHVILDGESNFDIQNLYILGSPSKSFKLNAFHHTHAIYEKNIEDISKFLVSDE